MKLHLFEGRTAGMRHGNWGKFAVGMPGTDEWAWHSQVDQDDAFARPWPLLRRLGWGPKHVWVWDLATGEGGVFVHGGHARADLNKRAIWVCPLFEPFLTWLYKQDLTQLDALPRLVELDAEFELAGYRRPGLWYHRPSGRLRVLPGPGTCHG